MAAGGFLIAKFIRTRLHRTGTAALDNMYLLRFNFGAAVVMLLALHGTSVLKIAPILTINYLISKRFGASKFGPICSWIFNVVILFLNDWHSGYKFENVASSFAFLVRYTAHFFRLSLIYLSRMSMKESTRDGTLASILRCFGSYPSAWTITGHAMPQAPLRYAFRLEQSFS